MVKIREKFGPSGEDGSYGETPPRLESDTDPMQMEQPSASVTDSGGIRQGAGTETPTDFLSLARDSFEDSTRYLEANYRLQWERNERAFKSQHPAGSKYASPSYKHRSKLFRPKTRAVIRQGEASLAAAMFSTEDVLSVNARNDAVPLFKDTAELMKEMLTYRLSSPDQEVSIPWFKTVLGAYQDARKYGIVISYQHWDYEEAIDEFLVPVDDGFGGQMVDPATNAPLFERQQSMRIVKDKPAVTLIPPENLRIDKAADWIDPINSSPYLIRLCPMYIGDVLRRMDQVDSKTGQPQWRYLDPASLRSARTQIYDTTRQIREGREDSKESKGAYISEFEVVWIHENFLRWYGTDYVYYTAGVEFMLTDPKPIREVYLHGIRPFVMGYSLIESHRSYPSGLPDLTEGLQQMANEIANQRIDNVRLAMNKRYKARRGRNVDLKSLIRNVPGSVTLMDNIDDVDVMETRDVTQSAYAEQDRINLDFDEIAGNFSASSIQSNRSMNETVGGLQLLSGGANMIADYDMRVFVETWVEPVLRQLVMLEQHYETDTTLLALAGQKAQLWEKNRADELMHSFQTQDLLIRINVGIGATDPLQKLQRFRLAAETVGSIFGPQIAMMADPAEIIKEVFGALGYRDGMRFFRFGDEDPTVMMMQQKIQELERALETHKLAAESKVQAAQVSADSREKSALIDAQGRIQVTDMKLAANAEETDHQRTFDQFSQLFEAQAAWSKQRAADMGRLAAVAAQARMNPPTPGGNSGK